MQLTNLYFLPQKEDSLLNSLESKINILDIMLFFTLETIKALKIFIYEKEVGFFDPHVGDTSCQIRAYRVYLISKNSNYEYRIFLEQMTEEAEKLKGRISFFTNLIDNQKLAEKEIAHKSQKLHQFFSENKLIYSIPNDIFFLTSSYFLTHFKFIDSWGNTHINLEAIEKKIRISRKLAKKIVRDQQLKLAYDSISFMKSLQKDIGCNFLSSFNFSHLLKSDDNGRKVLPCYLTMKFLFNHMRHKNTPILLIINRQVDNRHIDTLFVLFIDPLPPIHLTESYVLNSDCIPTSIVVIQGLVEYTGEKDVETQKDYIRRLSKIGLEIIIFANMAFHPQYSGRTLAYLSLNPFIQNLSGDNKNIEICNVESHKKEKRISHELQHMQKVALKIGCCDENRSLFFIRHIYCDTIFNAFSQIYLKSVA